jgi:multicomponent Na+:H+ antiporter subunit G
MSVRSVVVVVFLVAGIGVQLICSIGILAMRDVFDRLHFLSAASTVGAPAIALAIAIDRPASMYTTKALLVTGFLVITGPALTHSIARAARALESRGRSKGEAAGESAT